MAYWVNNILKTISTKNMKILFINLAIFVPMWAVFLINNLFLQGHLNRFGCVHPRSVSLMGIIEIFTPWLFHENFQHIIGNSSILLPLIFIISVLELSPGLIVALLIAFSGLATWILGSAYSCHYGASGLVFACFGFLLCNGIVLRKIRYLIPTVFVIVFYLSTIIVGLLPQYGISLAGHLGGFISGAMVALIWEKKSFGININHNS